ncbi:MAG: mannose-1-phosphate guanylyltransferase [Deltaproteobacteria bacterium]|nr:mannose-1-phosphate guanylyltransferase [Deltaproteobacteria bacterium]
MGRRQSGHRWAAILAGGAGTRFWPASRKAFPKPFLDILGSGPLARVTGERVLPLLDSRRLVYVLGSNLERPLREMLPRKWNASVVLEPIARNTLGAVLLAMGKVLSEDPDGRLAIFPADHQVRDVPRFRELLRAAFDLADRHVVTLGIVPAWAETGYGYIRRGKLMSEDARGPAPGASRSSGPAKGAADGPPVPVYSVARFVEKPDRARARRYVASGDYFWNSGIFVLHVASFLEKVRSIEPDFAWVADGARALFACGKATPAALRKLLAPLPCLNIDKAVMERIRGLVVLPADVGWSDVGTWDALFAERDRDVNSLTVGRVLESDGAGNVVVSTRGGPLVVVHGVKDLIVVATPDAVLVTRRGMGQRIGKLTELVAERGHEDLL